VNIICKRLNSTIALLKIINYYLCPEMKTMFYNCYFMSISDYCCFIWGKKERVFSQNYSSHQNYFKQTRSNSIYTFIQGTEMANLS